MQHLCTDNMLVECILQPGRCPVLGPPSLVTKKLPGITSTSRLRKSMWLMPNISRTRPSGTHETSSASAGISWAFLRNHCFLNSGVINSCAAHNNLENVL